MTFKTWINNTGNQIPIAVVFALSIGLAINKLAPGTPVEINKIVGLPGDLWIRGLKGMDILLNM
jgi:hypothetical protein